MKKATRHGKLHAHGCMLTLCMAMAFAFCGMSCTHREHEEIEERVLCFANNYFNLRYSQAAKSCTPQSVKWLKQKAASIRQADLDVLNNQTDTAHCTIDDIRINGDSAIVTLSASNFMACDSIGRAGTMCASATFRILAVADAGGWTVALNGPLESIRNANK